MGRGFETDMRGKMGERGGYLKVSQKRSDTVGELIFHAASAAKRDVRVAA